MIAALVALAASLTVVTAAGAHPERPTFYPDYTTGKVPKYRTSGGQVIRVCKANSAQLLRRSYSGKSKAMRKLRARRLRQLLQCRYRDIQKAVDKARNGARIQVFPGTYREEPSLKRLTSAFDYDRYVYDKSRDQSACKNMYTQLYNPLESGLGSTREAGANDVPSYEYQRKCRNAQNLIGIMGDGPDPDRRCDDKCNIQIEGMGRSRRDVVISGSRKALNVIRADRADGVYLKNFLVEFSDFNNIYALETNGFAFDNVESRYSREYGLLSFTSDNGLYDTVEAYGAGDSGIYPGSGPEGGCKRYGIEIRNSKSHGNTIGYSGTAGNGVWAHDNQFYDNSAGMTTDSFAANHPGMPQDCAKFERNRIYSNNRDFFDEKRDEYCKVKNRSVQSRDPRTVCPTFQVPVGTGIGMFGANENIVRDNWIYDNWRDGVKLLWVPAAFRGADASKVDTSFGNIYRNNKMGVRPDGTRDPNGNDFWWDEEGARNCWSGNTGPGGAKPSSNVLLDLPGCPGSDIYSPGNAAKTASQATCATWDPQSDTMDDPPGCDWFTVPPEPK